MEGEDMKKLIWTVALLLTCATARGEQFENPMLNMTVPSGLESGQSYLMINIKPTQPLKDYPKDDLYAILDKGANAGIEFRYMAGLNIEAKAGYITGNREQYAGASYTLLTPKLFFNSQLDVQFFSYKESQGSRYDQNLFYLLSLQSVPILDERLAISADLGYDGFNGHIGLGLGASYEIKNHVRLLAEYYPVFKGGDPGAVIGSTGCYSVGLKIDTFGHQFIFKVGNSGDIGTRRMMLGTNTQDVFVGITLMRLIAF
jgi:hypothetical protein